MSIENDFVELLIHAKDGVEFYLLIGTLAVAFFGYTWKTIITNRDKARRLAQINKSFQEIVKTLTTSSITKERLAAALLLRRFFDKKGEYSIRILWSSETPYAKAALDLIAALLKISGGKNKEGNYAQKVRAENSTEDEYVQKALADSLNLCGKLLHGADLQSVNLTNAYLGSRRDTRGQMGDFPKSICGGFNYLVEKYYSVLGYLFGSPMPYKRGANGIVLRGVDFFEANLERASLTDADCKNAIFYGAIMNEAVLKGANLSGANFTKAILTEANFTNVHNLDKAKFTKSNLAGADFTEADLAGADFTESILIDYVVKDREQGKSEKIKMPAIFTNAKNIDKATFDHIYLTNGCFDENKLKNS